MNRDGTGQRRLLPLDLWSADWSHDGNRIVFSFGPRIYTAQFDGENIDTLSFTLLTPEGNCSEPAWSPDDSWIAFDRSISDSFGPSGIWMMRPDGSEKQWLAGGGMPSWHPDGNSLIYVIGAGTSPGLGQRFVRYYLDSSPPDTMQVRLGAQNHFPKYSPDATRIAFVSYYEGTNDLFLGDSLARNITPLLTGGVYGFSWNRDGTSICYAYYSLYDFSYENGTLWEVKIPSGVKAQLTFNFPQ